MDRDQVGQVGRVLVGDPEGPQAVCEVVLGVLHVDEQHATAGAVEPGKGAVTSRDGDHGGQQQALAGARRGNRDTAAPAG